MARFKPAVQNKPKAKSAKSLKGAVPCLVLIIGGIAIVCLMFYLSLQSGGL